MRGDGHVARAMAAHHERAKASTAARDCLHYCFPGPTDAWAVALYNLLVNHDGARASARATQPKQQLQPQPQKRVDSPQDPPPARLRSLLRRSGARAARTLRSAPPASSTERTAARRRRRLSQVPPPTLEDPATLPTAADDPARVCAQLVDCERAGRMWEGRLMAAAADGHWTVPCTEAYPAAAAACARAVAIRTALRTRLRRQLVVFTHLPKAGGSSFGHWLSDAMRARSPLEACHVLWNGREAPAVCERVRTWLARKPRSLALAPPLPLSRDASLDSHNATLASAVPFRHCSLLWAQHVDYSIVEAIEAAQPRVQVRARRALAQWPDARLLERALTADSCARPDS